MTQDQDATAAVVTVADESGGLWRELPGKVAGRLPRRETRQNAAEMVAGLLMELADYNCWTIAEAAGHAGLHKLQHLPSRAVRDDEQVLERAAAWRQNASADSEAILAVDETADAQSSADAARGCPAVQRRAQGPCYSFDQSMQCVATDGSEATVEA